MKNVAILVVETAVIEAVADPRYMFTAVNEFLKSRGEQPLFHVQLVGLGKEVKLADGLFSIHTDTVLKDARKPDLIIIPALSGNLEQAIRLNEAFIPWIVQQYKQGAEVASLCLGAFLLASTGLLNGRSCSTHWLFVNEFRSMFPEVDLVDSKVITEQSGLYSSGGANSYWNLLLHLVEKYTNRDMAILASKFFVLDIDRKSQSPFNIFKGQKLHEDDEIVKAQEFIEANYQERISIDELCSRFGIGRRTFERRFRKATNNSVVEYIQRVKIEAAKKQLENGRKTVSEVMYDVGYTDTKAFRDVFKKVTSVSPVEYRNKYNKEMLN
ncbi:MAG: helix-turn-helix domain-containing protein [Chitinophagaceae bacterium]|jgi:transcriptional regulator GlxA family with amidase domain|nr:helix-turn-helix domain-containing protein [Chitinophagaceae bacterium]